jgi:DNA-binding response OmpR family regulator
MLAKRVLVVEDDALVSMAVEAEIAGCDHAVVGPFGSGADALASLGFVEPPDAAVIDLRLRDGSCLDLARALRRYGVPFLVYTGCLAPVEMPADLRAAPWIEKPALTGRLAAAVNALLRAHVIAA